MVKEHTHGQMVESMKENMKWTKNMAMENINGLMEDNMRVSGIMENNMEKENIYFKME